MQREAWSAFSSFGRATIWSVADRKDRTAGPDRLQSAVYIWSVNHSPDRSNDLFPAPNARLLLGCLSLFLSLQTAISKILSDADSRANFRVLTGLSRLLLLLTLLRS